MQMQLRNDRGRYLILLAASCFALSIISTACSRPAANDPDISKQLVLEVKQNEFVMTMHPRFRNNEQSLVYLDVRKGEAVQSGAEIIAHLVAKDGHTNDVKFVQDPASLFYIATVPLKHHEDYVIEAEIALKDEPQTTLRPVFSFHCGDPIPDLIDAGANSTKKGSKKQ